MIRLGIVADTHVPERAESLHPNLLEVLSRARVRAILHAGDICVQRVLSELAQVAPVSAVRGNRDILLGHLPLQQELKFGQHTIGLMHGHGNFFNYITTKLYYLGEGYRLARYLPFLQSVVPHSEVVVFGHTHHRENFLRDGRLFFNPGPAIRSQTQKIFPSIGFLDLHDDGSVTGKIVELKDYTLVGRQWVPVGITGISSDNIRLPDRNR